MRHQLEISRPAFSHVASCESLVCCHPCADKAGGVFIHSQENCDAKTKGSGRTVGQDGVGHHT